MYFLGWWNHQSCTLYTHRDYCIMSRECILVQVKANVDELQMLVRVWTWHSSIVCHGMLTVVLPIILACNNMTTCQWVTGATNENSTKYSDCMADQACDRRNIALKWQLEVTSHLLVILLHHYTTADGVLFTIAHAGRQIDPQYI